MTLLPSNELLLGDDLLPGEGESPNLGAVAERLYDTLGRYQPEDEDLGWPWLCFIAGCAMLLQPFDEAVRDRPDGSSGIARLLDPEEAPSWALDWLAMFPGVEYPINVSDAQKRHLLMHVPAQDRGSQSAIEGAARLHLADPANSHVFISAPTSEGPLTMLVVTLKSETPDQAQTLRDLTSGEVITAGIKVTYECVDRSTIAEWEAEASKGTIAEWEAEASKGTIAEWDNEGVI